MEKHTRAATWLRRNRGWLSAGMGLALALFLSGALIRCEAQAQAVRQNTLRLHILAQSDTAADQEAKLRVRDAVLARAEQLTAGAGSRQEAERRIGGQLAALALCAAHTLRRCGQARPVTVSIEEMYFATRNYGGATLPAGNYRALRLRIGEGAGHNWWCCLYPELCLAACTGYEEPEQQDFVTGRYVLRFKAVEWWQKLTGAERLAAEPVLAVSSHAAEQPEVESPEGTFSAPG